MARKADLMVGNAMLVFPVLLAVLDGVVFVLCGPITRSGVDGRESVVSPRWAHVQPQGRAATSTLRTVASSCIVTSKQLVMC